MCREAWINMVVEIEMGRGRCRVTMQGCRKGIQNRCFSFTTATVMAALLTLAACANQHYASLFPNGDDWLKWSESQREQYVSAYAEGMNEGFRNGCDTALEATLPDAEGQRFLDANARCVGQAPFTGRNLNLLIPNVTSFFQRYPEQRKQRNLGVRVILRKLDEGRTVEEIHAEFLPHP